MPRYDYRTKKEEELTFYVFDNLLYSGIFILLYYSSVVAISL